MNLNRHNRRQVIALLLVSFFSLLFELKNGNYCYGQAPDWVWARRDGFVGNEHGQCIATDINGNVLISGSFDSPIISFGSTTLNNAGNSDFFVAKYDANGNVLWAKSAGGASADWGSAIATDAAGNVFVTGTYQSSSITFGVTTLTNAASSANDIFVVKYDPAGNVVWAKGIGGTYGDVSYGICTDLTGNILITGTFQNPTLSFGSTTITNNSSNGSTDIFIAKYNTSGAVLWAKDAGGPNNYEEAKGITTDISGNVFLTGGFTSASITFGSTTLTNSGGYDLFIAKYDASGNPLWAKGAGGSDFDEGSSVSCDINGNVVITGEFSSSTIIFGTTTLTNTSTGYGDVFVVKYGSGGNAIWAKSVAGASIFEEQGKGITVDRNGNSVVTGVFTSAVINFGPVTISNTNPSGYDDVFVAKYDGSGNVLWAKGCGGMNNDDCYAIASDTSGNIYITGSFDSHPMTVGNTNLTPTSGADIFIAKLGCNVATTVTQTTVSCTGGNNGTATVIPSGGVNPYTYVWNTLPVQQTTVTAVNLSAGTYTVTVTDGMGCVKTQSVIIVETPPSYPFNPTLDVTNNSVNEWTFNGSYKVSQVTNNFSSEINNYLAANGSGPQVAVPLKIHSDSAGMVKLKFLNIQYQTTDTISPSFVNAKLIPNSLPKNSIFSINVKVSDNEKVDSVKASFKNAIYNLGQVTPDSFVVSILADTIGYFPVTITVSDTNGLAHDTVLYVTIYSTTPDLEILSSNVNVSPNSIFINDSIHVTATVKNNSNLTISNAQVALIIDGVVQQTKIITINPISQIQVSFAWLGKWAQDTIVVKADPSNLIAEANENNNAGTTYIFVNDIYSPVILQATATPNPTNVGSQVFFKVKAIDSTGIASVSVSWQNQTAVLTYNALTTFYEGYVNANSAGLSNALITALDINNLSSSTSISIQVLQNLPDLKVHSSDFTFTPTVGNAGANISIQVKVHNSGSVNVTNASVILRVDGINVGSQLVNVIHDSLIVVSFFWQSNCGSHTFAIAVDSANAIAEINDANNTASIVHQFCGSITSYAITAQAVPMNLPLGSATNVQLVAAPTTASATVTVLWHNQNLNMAFDSLNNAYTVQIYPTDTGNYILPISFMDANGFQSGSFVQFRVFDSLPDLSANAISVNYPLQPNVNTQFAVSISNNTLQPVLNSNIYLLVDGQAVDSIQSGPLSALDSGAFQLSWLSTVGSHQLTVTADLRNQLLESDETNNSKSIQFTIQDNQPPVIHSIAASTPIYQGGSTQVSSYITDNGFVVSAIVNFMGNNYPMLYDSVSGTWKATLNTPLTGNFPISIIATDNSSLTASSAISIFVRSNIPDLAVTAQNIACRHIDSVTNTVTALLQNLGGGVANNVKVHFAIGGVLKDSLLLNFLPGQTDTAIFIFNYPVGFYTVTITIDPFNTIIESNDSNNSATRILFIPDLTSPSPPVVTVVPSTWSASSTFLVSWNQVFDNSGTVTYEYSINGSTWTNVGTVLSTNVTTALEGLSYVYVRAKDSFGNLSQPGIGQMRYDNTAPNSPLIAEYHCGNSWTTHESPYLEWLNPGDIGSGIERFELSIDNGGPVNIGFNFNKHDTLNSGVHTLKVRAVDYVGHAGQWSNIITVYIDLDNPNCPYISSSTHPDQNTWYANDSIALSWIRPSETSSVSGFYYMLNHDSIFYADRTTYWIGEDSLIIATIPSMDTDKVRLTEGTWYLHISSMDTVGHLSSQSCSYRFKIDKTPPITTANYFDTVTYCNYSFALHSEDYFSGVAHTYFRVNGSNWISDTTVHLNTIGVNLIEYYSIDIAGNTEEMDSAIVFIDNSSISLNLGSDTIVCQGQAFNLDAGNSGATFTWSDGTHNQNLSINQTGKYWVNVENNGCQSSDTIDVQFNSPTVSIISDSTIICAGDSSVLCATPGLVSYLWHSGQTSPCISVKQAGNYYLTVTDQYGCTTESNHVAVTVYPLPPVSIAVNGDTLTAYNAATYQWFRNDSILLGATSELYIVDLPGLYSVLVSDTNGCYASSNKVVITLGIQQLQAADWIQVYPNPMESGGWNLFVSDNLIGEEYQIFDNDSKLVYRSIIQKPTSQIDIPIARGVYMLRINTSRNIIMRKLVKM